MARTKKKVINYPHGHPYILYQVSNANGYGITVAATDRSAVKKMGIGKAKAKPIKIVDMIKDIGHKETNQVLSKFGARWMTKEGKVFYKNV